MAKAILLIPSPFFYTPAGPVTKPVNQERKETTALTEVERAQGAAPPVGVEFTKLAFSEACVRNEVTGLITYLLITINP